MSSGVGKGNFGVGKRWLSEASSASSVVAEILIPGIHNQFWVGKERKTGGSVGEKVIGGPATATRYREELVNNLMKES